jgi:RNA 2',3'-cyclic 3'-phosphodiesterase
MRLFFAIPLPQGLRDALARLQAQVRALGFAASWPDPQGMHLTVAFLGEQDEACLPALRRVAEWAAARHAPFPLRTSHPGGFPRDNSARVLWLGLEDQASLRALAEDLRSGLLAAGVTFDDKPFKPHLTVARFKAPREVICCLQPPPTLVFTVGELLLYRSLPLPAGARYVPLARAPLGAGTGAP